MGNRDHLERNIERLLRAVRPELELPEDKKEEILANLTTEAAAISSKDSAGPSSKTVLLQHPAKLVAAAALIIGICAGAIWLLTASPKPKEQLAIQPKDRIEETLPDKEKPDTAPAIQQTDIAKVASEIDLKRLAAMLDTGNIKGLTAMLSDEAAEIRIAAANYLAQIGDFAAVQPLLEAGKEWTGTEEDNPFVNAIYQIMLRMSRQQAEATAAETQEEADEQVKFEFKPQGVLSGLITEANYHLLDAVGAAGYLALAVLGYVAGTIIVNFINPAVVGTPGRLFSGGIIPLANLAILVKVAAGLTGAFLALAAFRPVMPTGRGAMREDG